MVVYGGDNKVVYHWIANRKSGVRSGRLLIRVLNLVEMRFRCQIVVDGGALITMRMRTP